ncbi:hypothetical protein [Streptomyces sp. NPDC102283]|uniref:hypothetical protein n=1 Tax=Streptomyces sp. NPDC102283 TaxID=3366155 RepID=UPI00381D2B88
MTPAAVDADSVVYAVKGIVSPLPENSPEAGTCHWDPKKNYQPLHGDGLFGRTKTKRSAGLGPPATEQPEAARDRPPTHRIAPVPVPGGFTPTATRLPTADTRVLNGGRRTNTSRGRNTVRRVNTVRRDAGTAPAETHRAHAAPAPDPYATARLNHRAAHGHGTDSPRSLVEEQRGPTT